MTSRRESRTLARKSCALLRHRRNHEPRGGRRAEGTRLVDVQAVRRVLEKASLGLKDIDLLELNEAFAAQVLADGKELGLDYDRVNVHGGAIALGHPIGASGARVLVTLLHAMQRRGARRGLASLCLGGGNAVAMVVERA